MLFLLLSAFRPWDEQLFNWSALQLLNTYICISAIKELFRIFIIIMMFYYFLFVLIVVLQYILFSCCFNCSSQVYVIVSTQTHITLWRIWLEILLILNFLKFYYLVLRIHANNLKLFQNTLFQNKLQGQ